MKKLLLLLMLSASALITAQEDYQYNITSSGEGQEIKSTKEAMMFEKVFGGTSQFMFFSLSNTDGIPVLNFQYLAKSKEFPKIYCLDQNSRIYIQLANGKVATLICATKDQCSGLIYDSEEKNNIRVLTGNFLFTTGSLDELEKSAISFIRIKYATDTIDYPIKRELTSETNSQKYYPENYFINTLKCIQ
jgi:hypothetical protein